MIEIERKFLVRSDKYKLDSHKKSTIIQGYLNSNLARSVRVRVKDEKAFLTIKGKSNEAGTIRFEWEQEIPKKDAMALLELCEPSLIQKTRYLVNFEKHVFEVDEFSGENNGLTIAEVELASEDEFFGKPNWLGEEVTGQVQYYNSRLSKNPFSKW